MFVVPSNELVTSHGLGIDVCSTIRITEKWHSWLYRPILTKSCTRAYEYKCGNLCRSNCRDFLIYTSTARSLYHTYEYIYPQMDRYFSPI